MPIGILRSIATTCSIEHGEKAEHDAFDAIVTALLELQFVAIADAHSAKRYLTRVCAWCALC